jgi:hypothetical protein
VAIIPYLTLPRIGQPRKGQSRTFHNSTNRQPHRAMVITLEYIYDIYCYAITEYVRHSLGISVWHSRSELHLIASMPLRGYLFVEPNN